MRLNKSIFIFSLFVSILACQSEKSKQKSLTQEIEFENEATLRFIQKGDTLPAVFEIELAESDYEKETGLMYRKDLKSNQGMLFIYEDEKSRPSFYMKNTYIPLDLIYLDKNKNIVDFNLNTIPLSEDLIPSDRPSSYVLELRAGTVNNTALKIGDKMVLNKKR